MDSSKILNSIVFMGCKHCGKSTHGKALAEKLQWPFFDTDNLIEQNINMPFREFYKQKGATAFLLEEEKACQNVVQLNSDSPIIVSTGGGICDNSPALTHLRSLGKFVFLKLNLKYSVSRIEEKIIQTETGNFLNVPAYILQRNPKSLDDIHNFLIETFEQRFLKYQAIADIVIELENAPIHDNFELICSKVL